MFGTFRLGLEEHGGQISIRGDGCGQKQGINETVVPLRLFHAQMNDWKESGGKWQQGNHATQRSTRIRWQTAKDEVLDEGDTGWVGQRDHAARREMRRMLSMQRPGRCSSRRHRRTQTCVGLAW